MASFSRNHAQPPVFHVLTPQGHNIASPNTKKEEEGERKPRLGTDRMTPLELAHLINRPGMKATTRISHAANVPSRVDGIKTVSTAQPNIADSHLRRLLAAPGVAAFRSRSILTWAADRTLIGQSRINRLSQACVAPASSPR